MRGFLAIALLLIPTVTFAAQAGSSFSVGLIIVGPSQSKSAKHASARMPLLGARAYPFRRYVVQGSNGLRIQTTEF
ncbi:MAG: hypothetical protein ACXWJW_07955 [Xanthobacteraceae bacterium]